MLATTIALIFFFCELQTVNFLLGFVMLFYCQVFYVSFQIFVLKYLVSYTAS